MLFGVLGFKGMSSKGRWAPALFWTVGLTLWLIIGLLVTAKICGWLDGT